MKMKIIKTKTKKENLFFLRGSIQWDQWQTNICFPGQQSFLVKLSTWIRQIEGEWNSGNLSHQMPPTPKPPTPTPCHCALTHPPQKNPLAPPTRPTTATSSLLFLMSLVTLGRRWWKQGSYKIWSPFCRKKANVSWSLIERAAWLFATLQQNVPHSTGGGTNSYKQLLTMTFWGHWLLLELLFLGGLGGWCKVVVWGL